MKKILSIIALFAITITALNAKTFKPINDVPVGAAPITTSIVREAVPVLKAVSSEVLGGDLWCELHFGGQAYQTNCLNQTPISYEPYSGTLFLLSNARMLTSIDENGDYVVQKIGILEYSQDLGRNWDTCHVYDYTEVENVNKAFVSDRFYTSVATVNPKRSNRFSDVSLAYRSWVSANEIIGQQKEYKASVFGFITGDDILAEKKAIEAQIDSPWSGTAQNIFLQSSILATSANAGDHGNVYFYGRAWAKENSMDTTQFVLIGVDVSNINDYRDGEDLIVEQGYGRNIDEVNKYFGGFEPGKNTTYLCTPCIDADTEGNLYMLTLDLGYDSFTNGETNPEKYHRIPRIFKSAPNGQNFQLIDSIPDAVVEDYLNSIFAATDEGFGYYLNNPFNFTDCFVALEEDHYVFVTDLYYHVIGDDGNARYIRQLTEFEKKDGKWNVRKIDQLNVLGFVDVLSERQILAPFELYLGEYSGKPALFAQTNGSNQSSNYEIQLAKTADGKNLVTKYINLNEETQLAILEDTIDLYFVFQGQTDNHEKFEETRQVRTKDFPYAQTFLSYRSLDGNEWSTPVKAINSEAISTRYTMMPHIVPSIYDVPLAFCVTTKRTNSTDATNVFHCSLPNILANNVINNYNYGLYQLADATQDSQPFGNSSIEEGPSSDNYKFIGAYPNPADSKVNFEFSLANPGFTTMTVYNSLGEVVTQVINEYLDARNYTVSFETSNLPAGAYYCILNNGTKMETKMFNIAR